MRPSGVTVAQRHGQALTATLGQTAWCAQVVARSSAQVGSELRPGRSHGRGDVAIGLDAAMVAATWRSAWTQPWSRRRGDRTGTRGGGQVTQFESRYHRAASGPGVVAPASQSG